VTHASAYSLPTCWVTGARGLIGSYLARTAPQLASGWQVIGIIRDGNLPSLARAERDAVPASLTAPGGVCYRHLDLADVQAVRRAFNEDHPRLIIHCAALSRSPACEDNPSLARKLTVEITACLVELAADVAFVFFSSDLVFDGEKGGYIETDEPKPWCVYSETKIAAEAIVLANPRHTVVRISLNGGTSPTGDRGFNEEMRRAWQAGRTLKLFVDEFRCPLPAVETSRAIWELVAQNKPGLYHVAGSERLSRWEIGQLLAARWPQLNPRIEPSSRKNYTGPTRPRDTSLNCAKIQELLSFRLPGLSEWLKANPSEPF
jgi:dTDP-4-dehydrorhamnose reductase